MTGFGEAQAQQDGLIVSTEIRTINNRFLKFSLRITEGYNSLESQVEGLVRKAIRRGTIQVNVRVDRPRQPDDYKVNTSVLESYRRQLATIQREWDSADPVSIDGLLLLPGVISDDSSSTVNAADDWPLVKKAVAAALANLDRMRTDEGQSMAADLKANCQAVAASLDEVESRAPLVADAYRKRLHERMSKVLAETDVAIEPGDLLKEVSLFADRGDISEETVRLRSHLEQFDTIMQSKESAGRKLEFVTQEMVRESNTIGSKANDVEIAKHVIDIKAALERIREMIQNVE